VGTTDKKIEKCYVCLQSHRYEIITNMAGAVCEFCHLPTLENIRTHQESCYEEQLIAFEPYLGILYGETTKVFGQNKTISRAELDAKIREEMEIEAQQKEEQAVKAKQLKLKLSLKQDIQFTPNQKKALKYSIKKSALMSRNTSHILLEKIIELGHNLEDYNILMEYVQNLDVIMFMPLFSKDLYVEFNKDCRIKNLFEVNTGRGGTDQKTRASWETTMFNGFYDNAEPHERVKYGSLNIDSNPDGVMSTVAYGDAFIVLKQEVKYRITLVYGDSSGISYHLHIATPKYLTNILNYIPTTVLDAAIRVAKGQTIEYASYQYIEAQIHGELRMDRDVAKLIIKRSLYVSDKGQAVVEMCNRFGIELVVRG